MNVAIACGGTGGHLFPGLAVAEVLRGRGHEVLLFISEKEIDALAVRDHAERGDLRFERLPSVGLGRLLSLGTVRFLRGAATSVLACRRIFRDFRPDAVLGMGGFTSTAPLLAARLGKIPTFIHESNAIPGKANRLNARLARVVLLGFAECAEHFPKGTRCETTGTPIRASLRGEHVPDRRAALAGFGFDPTQDVVVKRTLLVMGGSQGARGVNRAVTAALPAWRELPLRVIHLTGRDEENEVRAAYADAGVPAHVAAFSHDMGAAYAAADVAIARSGAASLTELAHFGLPSILIPYPFAAEDHQTANARLFTRPGAAVMLRENEGAGASLARILPELLHHPDKLRDMAAAARVLAPGDAAARAADAIEKAEGGRRTGFGDRSRSDNAEGGPESATGYAATTTRETEGQTS